MFAYPNGVELVHGLLNQFGVVGEDARLEVAGAFSIHADACPGEVCAANVGRLAVEDQYFEMHSRTECPFKTIEQSWIFVEIFAEGWSRFLGMDEPDFDTFFDKLSQDRKERLHLRADLDMYFNIAVVFYVCKNSKESFHQKCVEAPVFGKGDVLCEFLLFGIFPDEFRKVFPKGLAVMVMFEVSHFVKDDIIHQLLGKYDDDWGKRDVIGVGALTQDTFAQRLHLDAMCE